MKNVEIKILSNYNQLVFIITLYIYKIRPNILSNNRF